MTPERWQQVKDLLAAAMEQPADNRRAFLDERVNGDEELRTEIESLLAHEEAGDNVIDSPKIASHISLAHAIKDEFSAAGLADSDEREDDAEILKVSRVGPYKIIRELGRGGVGSVLLGERDDHEYRQQVAIKLIRRGMDTDFVVRRFRNERQILAALEHANIAGLIDGGTTENDRPYLVMEYVEGKQIDVYCDEQKLSTEERLKIFQQVCAAVHYAHQRLIIHRDLKPSNILVTKEGTPKLLDFGIAKLLTPELAAQTLDPTLTAMRLLTPAYASPEQIRGAHITIATDVYSLGVLLHELLTGHKPYPADSRAPLEMMQAVLEKEATKPSTAVMIAETRTNGEGAAATIITPESVSKSRNTTPENLRRRLRGDLDNIVLMALRKDPQRRYASVQQFSEDIRRHLKGLPVIARNDTFGYRAAKFIRRNRIAVAAAAMILLTLVGGIVAVNQQRRRAERRFNDVRKLANSVVFDYHDAIADLPGSTPARQRMVKDALEYLDSLANEASGDRTLQRELAAAYQKIGDVQGNSNMANLGDTAGALASYRRSLAIRELLARQDPADLEMQTDLVESHERIGDVLRVTGAVDEAEKSYQQAITLLEKTSAPNDQRRRQKLADLLYRVGNLKGYARTSNLGDTKGAVEFHRRAIALREELSSENPNDINLLVDLAESHRSLANVLASGASDLTSAEPHARKAVAVAESLAQQRPTHARALRVITEAQDALARILLLRGEIDDALKVCLESLRNAERSLAVDPKNMQARQDLASGYTLAGNIYLRLRDTANAIRHHRQALSMNEAMAADDPKNESVARWIGQNYMNLGMTLAAARDLEGALRNYKQGLALLERRYQQRPTDRQALQFIARLYGHLGELELKRGELRSAAEHLQQSVAVGERIIAGDAANEMMKRTIAVSYLNLGDVHSHFATRPKLNQTERHEHWEQARKSYQTSLTLFLDLRNRGVLPKEYERKPDEIPRKIAACDAALAKS